MVVGGVGGVGGGIGNVKGEGTRPETGWAFRRPCRVGIVEEGLAVVCQDGAGW